MIYRIVAHSVGLVRNSSKKGRVLATSLIDKRICTKCQVEYPAMSQYFYKARGGRLSHTCRWCTNKRVAQNTQDRKLANISFRIHIVFSKAICESLKGNKNGNSWEKLVGYTTKELMQHLESLFTENMSWNNYGKKGWVIDHIIPQSAFCFKTPTDIDFKRCWALSNLQPMLFIPNIRKGNRVEKPFQPSLPITVI